MRYQSCIEEHRAVSKGFQLVGGDLAARVNQVMDVYMDTVSALSAYDRVGSEFNSAVGIVATTQGVVSYCPRPFRSAQPLLVADLHQVGEQDSPFRVSCTLDAWGSVVGFSASVVDPENHSQYHLVGDQGGHVTFEVREP